MTKQRMMAIGIVAAVLLTISATATTFAAGTRFDHLDWSKYATQQYGYVRAAPNTGDGDALGSGGSALRGWAILGIAAGAALAIGGASVSLVRSRRS
jgi:hypothetical protein